MLQNNVDPNHVAVFQNLNSMADYIHNYNMQHKSRLLTVLLTEPFKQKL